MFFLPRYIYYPIGVKGTYLPPTEVADTSLWPQRMKIFVIRSWCMCVWIMLIIILHNANFIAYNTAVERQRQYLFTLQVSRYRLLSLQSRIQELCMKPTSSRTSIIAVMKKIFSDDSHDFSNLISILLILHDCINLIIILYWWFIFINIFFIILVTYLS